LLFVLFCVLFMCKCVLPPGDNPAAVSKYIIIIEYRCVNLKSFSVFYSLGLKLHLIYSRFHFQVDNSSHALQKTLKTQYNIENF
jgi:hypothetical protein